MITALIFAAALSGAVEQTPASAQDPTTVEGLTVMSRPKSNPADPLTDRTIETQLFQLLETQPERVVCAVPPQTGTRLPKPVCGSVERWFNARKPEDVAANRAPWQLVEEIKKNKRKAAAARRS